MNLADFTQLWDGDSGEALIRWTTAFGAVGIVLNAVEMVSAKERIFRFFDWRLIRLSYPFMGRRTRATRLFDAAGHNDVLLAMLVLQACASVGAIAASGATRSTLALFVFLMQLFMHIRLVYGFDGSDQMQTIVWGGVTAYSMMSSPTGRTLAIGFICFQFCLSYWTAGIAKLVSPIWRSGAALPMIFRTESYGIGLARRIVGHRPFAVAGCWSVILFEVLGPFALATGPRGAAAFCAMSFLFHVSIAVVMGLNSFVFAFAATLPCVFFIGRLVPTWF